MAYSNGLRSPQNESSAFPSNYASPIRPIGSQLSSNTTSSAERAGLHRRFTTNALPTLPTLSSLGLLSPIGQQRRQAADPSIDLEAQLIQQKRNQELENIREQRSRYQSQLDLFTQAKNELHRLEQEMTGMGGLPHAGYQSEPTTPPEYHDSGLAKGRSNRHSLASITSTPGIGSIASPRANRSGSQSIAAFSAQSNSTLPSFSVPQSRRGSDEEEDDLHYQLASIARRPNGFNRNSMPAMPSSTSFDFAKMQPEVNTVLGINNINSLLSDDDDEHALPGHQINGLNNLLHMETNGDGFPLLRRRENDDNMPASANTSSLDLVTALDEQQSNGWSSVHRHRAGQQSLPWNSLRNSQHEDINGGVFGGSMKKANANNRRSMDAYTSTYGTEPKRSSMHGMNNGYSNGVPKLQSSYSTNDIPTVKNVGLQEQNIIPNANMSHAEQHLHNHNASIGRIPMAVSNRQSRDLSFSEPRNDENTHMPLSSALQANAPAFAGLPSSTSAASNSMVAAMPSAYANGNGYYGGGYNMSMLNMGMNGMNLGVPQNGWQNGAYPQPHNNGYTANYGGGYGAAAYGAQQHGRFTDSQRNVMKDRKGGMDDTTRFLHYKLEDLQGQIYELCKDQHGCRFLQRKIEERNVEYIELIFIETKDHIVELMTDPFGNYLCQKMLEFCDDQQRTQLINNAAPYMTDIAFNQHGTRALQKMIEFISSQQQIETIKGALSRDIVKLIQDLNGNHVIQKCLNHLKPEDAEFIFIEVANNCYKVGTHRHGCCVLQRCIDHAVGPQKANLVSAVIKNAYQLVQDAFGNYVVQYILDLSVDDFTRPLCMGFQGCMVELSRQKFSSNVIEKTIRCSPPDIRRILCEEFMLSSQDVERHIRDSFANYVVQTILDHSDNDIKDRMWDLILPIMDKVRSTPAGRRLQVKLTQREHEKHTARPMGAMGNAVMNGNGFYQAPNGMAWPPAVNGNNNVPQYSAAGNVPQYSTAPNSMVPYSTANGMPQYPSDGNGMLAYRANNGTEGSFF